jgi:hypothetical protein
MGPGPPFSRALTARRPSRRERFRYWTIGGGGGFTGAIVVTAAPDHARLVLVPETAQAAAVELSISTM